ncbi:3-mercaptopyruvate sulfurtransferase [Methylomonas sp. AM2-LC]|uniref:3-mercaptopyruvate sulfurtransferase n=1 Tax=Methylomonas sp. AM2-LC TaxID=3153301 RepID=UPI0032647753
MVLVSDSGTINLDAHNAVVSCVWLQKNLHHPNLLILDATFFLPRQQRFAKHEFQSQHLPGAQFFDIDDIADQNSPLPHTLPIAEQFAQQVGKLGIDNATWVVVYDNNHFFAAARVWWMFRVFGHEKIKVLDGGLSRWKQLGFPLTSNSAKPASKVFTATFHAELFVDLQQMREIQQQGSRIILDARSADSFNGQRVLTDAGLQTGHMPGSVNIPYQHLYSQDQHTLYSIAQLQQLFVTAGVDVSKSMVTTCGSGVSAALLLLVLYQLGCHQVPMFDGSWAEWGRQQDLPKQNKPTS